MALTHTVATRNSLSDQIDTLVNTGATDAQGDLVFKTGGSPDSEVATINLSNPAFGAAASGTITLAGVPLEDTNATGGVVTYFLFQNRNNTEVFRGTVSQTGSSPTGDIQLSSTTIGVGDTVRITSFTYSSSI